MKKSNHNTTPSIPHAPFIPHTITLHNVVSKKLSFVVLLQYMTLHTLHFKAQQKNIALLRKKTHIYLIICSYGFHTTVP
jgi:hypothetical protein